MTMNFRPIERLSISSLCNPQLSLPAKGLSCCHDFENSDCFFMMFSKSQFQKTATARFFASLNLPCIQKSTTDFRLLNLICKVF
mmetsp:Transcript_25470/g.38631  ORF Transcript_25470/g.38631 Transcript_25470/m.38631 type:complete len:84 (+) Transcript_25470:162-413(+)